MSLIPAIALFALSTSITPGPNNAMIMASGLNHGIRKSLPHFAGINLGFFLMVICIGFGLGTVFESAPQLHEIIKIAGVLYLIYLAWRIAMTPTTNLDREIAQPLTSLQAALFQWVNPKAWVMISGAVATFTSQSSSIYGQVLLIAGIFITVGTPSCLLWLLGGVGLKRILTSPKQVRVFNVTMALLLVASMVPVVHQLLFL
jgi:threonine/homoserine/homoserine lactone efflux protein